MFVGGVEGAGGATPLLGGAVRGPRAALRRVGSVLSAAPE